MQLKTAVYPDYRLLNSETFSRGNRYTFKRLDAVEGLFVAKKLFFMLLLLFFGGFALLSYYWRQLTQLPTWYTPSAPSVNLNFELQDQGPAKDAKDALIGRIETEMVQQSAVEYSNPPENPPENLPENLPVEVELTAEEFNTLVAAEPTAREILQFAKGFNTTIDDGALESGIVINLTDVSTENLDPQRQEILQQVIQTFPGLENRDVYIGIEGQPKIEDGQLQWDQNTQIKVGDLSLSLEAAAQQLGLSLEGLQQLISLELGSLNISDIELTEQGFLIRGVVD